MKEFLKDVFTGVSASVAYAALAGLLSYAASYPPILAIVPAREFLGWVPWLIFISSYLFLLRYEKIRNLRRYDVDTLRSEGHVKANYRGTLWWGFGFALIHYLNLFRNYVLVETNWFFDSVRGIFLSLDSINSFLYGGSALTTIVGFSIVYYGLFVAIVARMYLDGFWSLHIIDKPEKIVTDGPYAACRHPIYSGQVIMTFGTAVLSGEILAYLFFVFVAYMNHERADREEIWLGRSELGAEYKKYSETTKRRFSLLTR